MNLDVEIGCCFVEGRVSGGGNDDFRMGHRTFSVCFVASGEDGEKDRFGAARSSCASARRWSVEHGKNLEA